MKKIVLAIVLLAAFCLSGAPAGAESESGLKPGDSGTDGVFSFVILEDNTAEITKIGRLEDYSKVVIPATVNGYPVTALSYMFNGMGRELPVKEVVLPEGLRVITGKAFRYCTELAKINFPESLEVIDMEAFYFTPKLKISVSIPNVRYIGYSAFYNSGITGLKTGDALETIENDAFLRCSELRGAVSLPFLKKLGSGAFESTAITSVSFSEGLEEIGDSAFAFCQKLTGATLPEGLLTIGASAFESCKSLARAPLPESLLTIGARAFCECSRLSELSAASVREIGDDAFSSTGLRSVALPGIVSIGNRAFYSCENLTKATFGKDLELVGKEAFNYTKLSDIHLYDKVSFIGERAFDTKDRQAVIEIDAMDTEFGLCALGTLYSRGWGDDAEHYGYENVNDDYDPFHRGMLKLTCRAGSSADLRYTNPYLVIKTYLSDGTDGKVTAPAEPVLRAGVIDPSAYVLELTVPEGVESIDPKALSGLRTLKKISLPSTLQAIGAGAFEDCVSLEQISIPNGVTEIADGTFSGCVKLKKLTLPKKLTGIGQKAFSDCIMLASVTLPEGLGRIGSLAFSGSGVKNIVIPDTVTDLGLAAFAASAVTSVKLPKNITAIPAMCFSECHALKSVQIPAGVTEIRDEAFRYCYSLASLSLPEGLVAIGRYAFAQNVQSAQAAYQMTGGKETNSALKTVKFPASLEKIGDSAFAACDALRSFTFAKGSRLQTIGISAFGMCLALTEVSLPDSVITVGNDAFVNCLRLKKADLGGGLRTLGDEALMYCGALTELHVPGTLEVIGGRVLEGHGAKLVVYCESESKMAEYLNQNHPDIAIKAPKGKK